MTNNQTELLAMLQIVRRLPYDWTGIASTDSAITRGRFSMNWKLTGIPNEWFPMLGEALRRINVAGTEWRLLQGHPLKSEIDRMKAGEQVIGSKRGFPVSLHQEVCDHLCTDALVAWRDGVFHRSIITADPRLTMV